LGEKIKKKRGIIVTLQKVRKNPVTLAGVVPAHEDGWIGETLGQNL
jgi:hypothetical protein